MRQKGQGLIFVIVGVLILAVAGGAYYLGRFSQNFSPTQKACTEESKICPNGKLVGRSGPTCEFTPCPSTSPNPSDETAKTFTSKEDCENITGKKCGFGMCDVIPPGKTFQEYCGGVSKGWYPVK